MPSGAKKRKAAAKKKQQQQQEQEQEQSSSSPQTNLNSNNHESRIQEERESDERIEIIDSSHDHDKSSSNSNSSSSDDDDNKETSDSVSQVNTETSVPNQPVPAAGNAPFIGSTANVIVENTGLMDLATPSSDPRPEEHIEISQVDTLNEADQLPLESDEVRQASPGEIGSDANAKEVKTSSLPESNRVPEGSVESEVVISHEEEAPPARPTHGVAQRTSWLGCCGLFDVVSGSSR